MPFLLSNLLILFFSPQRDGYSSYSSSSGYSNGSSGYGGGSSRGYGGSSSYGGSSGGGGGYSGSSSSSSAGYGPAAPDNGDAGFYTPGSRNEAEIFGKSNTGINFSKYQDIKVTVSGSGAPPPMEKFDETDLHKDLQNNIRMAKYDVPTPVQKHSIPIMLANRDLMASAQTGTYFFHDDLIYPYPVSNDDCGATLVG